MDNFCVLSGIFIEKCSFQVSCKFNAKSGTINQLTLGAVDLLATPVLHSELMCLEIHLLKAWADGLKKNQPTKSIIRIIYCRSILTDIFHKTDDNS